VSPVRTLRSVLAVSREGDRAFDGSIVELWMDGCSGVRRRQAAGL
jgi:hypothetical protein